MAIHIAICFLFLLIGWNPCEGIESKNEYKYLEQMIERQNEQMAIFRGEIKRQDEKILTLIEDGKRQDEKIQQLNLEAKQQDERMQRLNQEIKQHDERLQQLNKKVKWWEEQMEIFKLEIKQLTSENNALKKPKHKKGNNKSGENENDKGIAVDKSIEKRLLLDDPGQLQFELDQLKASVKALTSSKGGALYVQWGRKRCTGNNTETVYSGYAGGSFYGHTGGAAEYVCAPSDPEFGKYIPAQYTTYLFGAEYETDYFGQPWQEDVPCAVCRSVEAASALMIPGKNHCYQDWKMEYRGRLASGHYTHASASQYVCVDEHPEAIVGGNANKDGKLFYPVISECGSLPCPPYKNNTELLCVVCSK